MTMGRCGVRGCVGHSIPPARRSIARPVPYFMAHRADQDDVWKDVEAVALAIAILVIITFLASWIPS
jgi:hypothetical protein